MKGITVQRCRFFVLLLLPALPLAAPADPLDAGKEIRPFAKAVASRHGLDRGKLEDILSEARVLPKVLAAIERPAEAKPWKDYRGIFLNEKRIADGAEFWRRKATVIEEAAEQFGVAPEVIVAIIGVETLYGQRAGRIRVLDALATLGFRYPKRAKFFRSELEHFLILVLEERLDPLTIKGSYAGAMGIPQFIPSSYRSYSVDFDGDGLRDLLWSEADAIGSVANYLARHGWKRGAPITVPARVNGGAVAGVVKRGIKPHSSLKALRGKGIKPVVAVQGATKAALIELHGAEGIEHWVGFENFYVITRYNHSKLYAMAVFQLSQEIAARYGLERQ